MYNSSVIKNEDKKYPMDENFIYKFEKGIHFREGDEGEGTIQRSENNAQASN